jgi:hypothetical protein
MEYQELSAESKTLLKELLISALDNDEIVEKAIEFALDGKCGDDTLDELAFFSGGF